jgi:hypothetical protein
MKKLIFSALSMFMLLTTSFAGTWEVLCIKQGPIRGYSLPVRDLDKTATVSSAPQAGYPIPSRSIPTKANVAEMSDMSGDMNFVSLGFGGSIIMKYSQYIMNTTGDDLTIYETTWGNPSCTPNVSESAKVEFSQDGFNWVSVQACHNGSFDISPLMWCQYVRITDETNPNPSIGGDGNDAYDVDGITVVQEMEPSATLARSPICDYVQGVASQFVGKTGNFPGRGIASIRKNIENAQVNDPTFTTDHLLNPSLREKSGWYNFFSLGFGGYACFQLPYTVFDSPGADFQIFETTWNNRPCPSYPEKAMVYLSADGVNWSIGTLLCKDGSVDMEGQVSAANFIKLEDVTDPSDFGAGADGFDIDNIYVIQPFAPKTPQDICSGNNNVRKSVIEPSNNIGYDGVPENMFALELVGSNMVTDKISFLATIAEEGGYNYTIRNSQGQEMVSENFVGQLYDTPTMDINLSNYPQGVYFLTLTSNSGKETVKFVKK